VLKLLNQSSRDHQFTTLEVTQGLSVNKSLGEIPMENASVRAPNAGKAEEIGDFRPISGFYVGNR